MSMVPGKQLTVGPMDGRTDDESDFVLSGSSVANKHRRNPSTGCRRRIHATQGKISPPRDGALPGGGGEA